MRVPLVLLAVALVLVTTVPQGFGPTGTAAATAPHASVSIRPSLTQLDGYKLAQISLPNFAYLYPYLYNYRDQYPVVDFSGPCAGGVLYITNSSVLDCYTVANATAWPISPHLYLLHQRTVGIQGQIDNEFQLDAPYDVALFYGNNSTSAGPVTVETLNLTTGAYKTVATPVPMANSIQSDYVGGGLVVTWNATGTNGAPELTSMVNGTSWRSGLAVGVAANNVYWVPQLGTFFDVAGTHIAELGFNAARTSLKNIGNAWVNTTGLTSVTAVNGIAYYAATNQLVAQLATNLGTYNAVVKLTGGVLTQAGAYAYSTSTTLYISRYSYTTGYLWALTSHNVSVLANPITNSTVSVPSGLVNRLNASGADNNYEFTNPYSTAVYLSLNTSLTHNATRAPNQFVYATAPVAVHSRAFVLTNSGTKVGLYDQRLVVNSTVDAAWEAANLSNVFWTYASNGTSIPAWLQGNATSSSTGTIWWLLLAPLAHGAVVTVVENFAPTTSLTFGRFSVTGEAPQLTTDYGLWDNGATVFPLYDNFMGTTLDSTLWAASSITATVLNGLTTSSAPSASTNAVCGLIGKVQNVTVGTNFSVDMFGTTADAARFGPAVSNVGTSSACSTAQSDVANLDYSNTAYRPSNLVGVFTQTSAGTVTVNTCGLKWTSTLPYVMSIATVGTSQSASNNGTVIGGACGAGNYSTPSIYPAIWLKANSGTIGPVDWIRERVVPATMPTAATVPLAPSNVAVSGTSFTTVSLTWSNPPAPVVNDTVYGWLGGSCVGRATANSTVGAASAFTVGSLLASTSYSFRVAAWNATGQGVLSACVPATTVSGENGGTFAMLYSTVAIPLWVAAAAGLTTLILAVAWARGRD